jgi:putative membrane protein
MPELAVIGVFASADWTGVRWITHIPVVAGLVLTAGAYAVGWRRLDRAKKAAVPRPLQMASFYGGLTVLATALLSPLDRLSETLFSAHMIQHLVIVLAASPLLVLGAGSLPVALGLPRPVRRRIGGLRRGAAARKVTGWIFSPLGAGLLHAAALWLWHLPGPYQAAWTNRVIHAAEHLSFLLTAILFWRVVIGSGGRRTAGYLPAAGLVFATALQSTALGAILTLATHILYPVHVPGAASWGMSAIEDQQLAGAIMWIPAGGVYLMTIVALLIRAFSEVERRMLAREGRAGRPSAGLSGRR